MSIRRSRLLLLSLILRATSVCGHSYISPSPQLPLSTSDAFDTEQTWLEKYGPQIDQPFSGPLSFAHLPYTRCLDDSAVKFDIAILGMPFDTGVTYRPGARFGPFAIRSGSRRQRASRGYSMSWGFNPYASASGAKIIDCGDVPVSPFDNALAVDQMEVAYSTLLSRPPATATESELGWKHPRIVSLGGDHTIVLPILRALYRKYGPINLIHFDAHLDTWPGYPGGTTNQSQITHGTFLYLAHQEGIITNTSIHAGVRTRLAGPQDLENDEQVGFQVISADDIDELGVPEIVGRIRERVGSGPVYLSLDIDVLDPSVAPGTGTPEPAGWHARELKRILRGMAGLNFVGADLVEVSPAYDSAEVTTTVAADLVHDFLSMFLTDEPPVSRSRSRKAGGMREDL
ncbi:arginase deacetylase [Mycena amicta]|nr:arginase deacetylase [Mycena amicta]